MVFWEVPKAFMKSLKQGNSVTINDLSKWSLAQVTCEYETTFLEKLYIKFFIQTCYRSGVLAMGDMVCKLSSLLCFD